MASSWHGRCQKSDHRRFSLPGGGLPVARGGHDKDVNRLDSAGS
jgi:hypothetical protein